MGTSWLVDINKYSCIIRSHRPSAGEEQMGQQVERRVLGSELKIGDTLPVMWAPKRDTITAFRPYTGPLECLRSARIAHFAVNQDGMTIPSGSLYSRLEG